MLATFVIGLREGLEAALIVGIIAAFLTQDGKRKALRSMWIGVGIAVVICLGLGLALTLLSGSLPQRQQEMLEAVVGAVAVAMVTWMVLWMRKHSRNLKKELGAAVEGALATGSMFALVGMAFLAVIREGVETAVFLVAASQTKGGTATFAGAGLGITIAIVLGWLIYRGGVRINLSKFFRITGAVLVVVAGGVLMSTLAHAHEADWLNVGSQTWINLSSVITPGSVPESLLGGVLGIRAQLSAVSVIGWVLYVIPMLVVVLWPQRRMITARATARLLLLVGAIGVVAAALPALLVPAATAPMSQSFSVDGDRGAATLSVQQVLVSGARLQATVAGTLTLPGADGSPLGAVRVVLPGTAGTYQLIGARTIDGRSVSDYRAARLVVSASGAPSSITVAQLAGLNGGRYPVGLRAADAATVLDLAVPVSVVPTVTLDSETGIPVSISATADVAVVATSTAGRANRVDVAESNLKSVNDSAALAVAAGHAGAQSRARSLGRLVPGALAIWGALLIVAGGLVLLGARRRAQAVKPASAPTVDAHQPDTRQDTRSAGVEHREPVAASTSPRSGDLVR